MSSLFPPALILLRRLRFIGGFFALGGLFTMSPVIAGEKVDAGEVGLAVNWVRESATEVGWEGAIRFGLTDNLQIDLSGSRIRDTSEESVMRINGVGLEVSWWPISLPQNLSAGGSLTFSDGEKSVSNGRDVTLGLKWEPSAIKYEWEVGYDYSRNGLERDSTWGTALSFEFDLSDSSELAIELRKESGEKPSIEFEVEFDLTEIMKLSLSLGKQSEDTFGAVGIEYTW